MTSTSFGCQVDGTPGTVTVGPQLLDAGGRTLPYIDMDTVTLDGYTVDLRMHPAGAVRITALGPRRDAFLADLDAARGSARRAALLQWTGTPKVSAFAQAPAGPDDIPVAIHIFDDGLTVELRNGPPELVPFALLDRIDRDGYSLTMTRRGLPTVTVRRLGPRTDEFLATIERLRSAQRQAMAQAYAEMDDRLAGYTAPNGWAVTAAQAGIYGGALGQAFAAGARAAEVGVLRKLTGEQLRYGLARQPEWPLPFLLAAGAAKTAVEAVNDDQARATYVFATTDVDALNTALVLTSFRREVLYLPETSLGRWSLAARALPVVRWARRAYSARVVHDDNWEAGVTAALR